MTADEFYKLLENGPYAWPKGYPIFFVTDDGAILSFSAAFENQQMIAESIRGNFRDGWRVSGYDINYEDRELICDRTGERIPAAYED